MPSQAHSSRRAAVSQSRPDQDSERPVDLEYLPTGRGTVGLTHFLRDFFDLPSPDDPTISSRQKVIREVLKLAGRGDLKAIQGIWTRLEGKPGPPFDPAGEDPEPLAEDVLRRFLEGSLDGTNDEDQDGDEDASTHDED